VEEYQGIKVYRLPIMFQVGNTPINPLWYVALKKILREEKPDIINAHQPVPFIGDLAALVSGSIPFVLTYHAGTMRKKKFLWDILISLYEMVILPRTARKAARIICVSNFVRDTLLKKHICKSTVIHPGVDVALFKADALVEKDKGLVLFVCTYKSMHKMKGFDYLMHAVKSLPEARLRVVGEKGDFLDSKVSYAGTKRGEALVQEMQRAAVVVLPSLAHMESFGMVLIEAMACQTPVIGTDIGGIPEVIADGVDGFVVAPKDSHALERAISKIVTNEDLAMRMGQSGVAKVREQFTWASRIDLTKKVYESCLQ
jgi:glycosyltransferase involved in cell wall biosynthesis